MSELQRGLSSWQPAIGPLTYQWPEEPGADVDSEIKAGHRASV
jgi:hypothetical protein